MKTKQQPAPLEQRVLRFILENNLVNSEQPLLVAVSGGPDSVCLLHILVKLREESGVKLHVAHLDHQLRGEESKGDAAYVKQMAAQLGLPVTIGVRDVKTYRTQHHLSLEEAAREARYSFLAEVAESTGASGVAVGHTTDDNIETILMHIIRGAGTRGLRGLQPSTVWSHGKIKLNVIRPLLPVTRKETAEYCRSIGLDPRQDSSNLSLSPLRNKIRLQLIPLLTTYNPRIREALLRTARLAGDDFTSLSEKNARAGAGIARRENGSFVLDKRSFMELPVSVQRHIIRETVQEILGTLKDVESSHITNIITSASKPAGRSLSLPLGLTFITEHSRFILGRESDASSSLPAIKGLRPLKIPGKTTYCGWHITSAIIAPEEIEKTENSFIAHLDMDKTGNSLLVRPRQPGDVFQPLGMKQEKELAEFMIDTKIPRASRSRIPIVASPGQIVWVAGHRIDDRVKVTPKTKKILQLEFKRA